MTFYLPMLILSLEMLLTFQFTQSVYPALLILAALYTPLFLLIRNRRIARLLCIPGVMLIVTCGWKSLPLLNPLVSILIATQLLQVACYILTSPLSVAPTRPQLQARAAANIPFFSLGLVSVYVAFSRHTSFLPLLAADGIGTVLLVLLVLQVENCVTPFRQSRPVMTVRAAFSWLRLGVVLVMITSTLTAAGFLTPHVEDAAEDIGIWLQSLGRRDSTEKTSSGPRRKVISSGGAPSRYRVGDRLELESEYDITLPHIPDLHLVVHDDRSHRALHERTLYVKCASFDTFNGNQWRTAATASRLLRDADDGRRDGIIVIREVVPNPITYTVCLRSCPSRLIPGIPTVAAIEQRVVQQSGEDVYASPVPLTNVANIAYTMTSSDVRWEDLSPGLQVPGKTQSLYTRLPPGELTTKIRAETQRILGPTRSPRLAVNKLLRHLRTHYTYATKTHNPQQHHPLDNFLFHEKRGHCELFASSFVLMLRAAGFPARMSAGYCGGEYDDQAQLYTFFRDNGHAWAEIYLERYGWVVIEPTPPDAALAPRAPRQVRRGWNFVQSQYPLLSDLVNIHFPEADVEKGRARRWYEALPGFMTPAFMLNVIVLVAAVIYVWTLRRASRLQRRSASISRPHQPPGFFRMFCRHFARLGCSIKPGQTAAEYLAELKARQLVGNEYDRMLQYFESVTYAEQPRSRSVERTFTSYLRRKKETTDH